MSLISINSTQRKDPYCRYKMKSVMIKTVEQGQYAKTTIINIDEISDSLYHPPDILFKFIGFNLGTQADFKKKTLKGSYESNVIQKSIDKYIDNFVLCNKCSIPEIDPEIEGKKKKVACIMHCAACGTTHKLASTDKAVDKTIKLIIKDLQSGNEWKKHKQDLVDPVMNKITDMMNDFDF